MALPEVLAEAREALPLEAFEDPRAREIAAALYAGAPVVDVASEAARGLASEIASSLDPARDYAAEWRGVLARVEQARGRFEEEMLLKSGRTDEADRALYERNRRRKTGAGAHGAAPRRGADDTRS
jgi:hypothetical protein